MTETIEQLESEVSKYEAYVDAGDIQFEKAISDAFVLFAKTTLLSLRQIEDRLSTIEKELGLNQ